MDTSNTNNNNGASTATTIPDDHEPSARRFLKNQEKTPSPPLKNRVIVYDCDDKSVLVQSKAFVRQNLEDYHEVRIPARTHEITIFVDSETESKPTIENTAPDGYSNVMLAKLYLDRLGAFNQVLRFFGQLSTLYVKNVSHWSETSSQASRPQTVDSTPQ